MIYEYKMSVGYFTNTDKILRNVSKRQILQAKTFKYYCKSNATKFNNQLTLG